MRAETLTKQVVEATLFHPNAYRSRWREGQKLNDRLFTEDHRRIWCRFDGENPELKFYKSIREEVFVVGMRVGVENDNTYVGFALTDCGNIIREVHQSQRHIDVLGPVIEEARLASPDEIQELQEILDSVLVAN